MARKNPESNNCGTRDNIEFEQRVIETIIAGIRYETVQRELLTKPKTLTLQHAVQLCRSYVVSIVQPRELKDVQHKHSTRTDQFVDAIKTNRTPCSYCGRTHTRHEVCPARGTFCKQCGNRTTGRKSADLDSNHKGCQHHIHQQPNNNPGTYTA